MALFSVSHIQATFPFQIPDIIALFVGGICAFLLAYFFTFGVIALCHRLGWLDRPAMRRIHRQPVPRLGGIAMFLAFVIASLAFYTPGSSKETVIYWLLLLSTLAIVLVHAYDDVKGLKPLPKFIAQTIAVIIILGPSGRRFHGVLLFGISNPFGRTTASTHLPWYLKPELTLFIHQPEISFAAIPAVLFTWFWIVGMMNTVNWIDGMDGLATGLVAITGVFITITSWVLGQHSIAILTALFTGAVFGFLPHNWNPARIFMGDSGSQFLGLGLAVLSIMGGAKVGAALMLLGIPILDVAVVVINRIRNGQRPWHFDMTHLHHRLLATGLSVRQSCYLFYGMTIFFGLLALLLTRFYKLIGIALVGVTMAALIIWLDYLQRRRGVPIRLGGPDHEPPDGLVTAEDDPTVEPKRTTPSEYEEQQKVAGTAGLPPLTST
jgi:UDP-GlcNAc:undecaprenyl-phosphate GlcNAc-1-phosphate transferase